MSLSFPTTPAVGQIYQGWTWNGSAWDPNYGNVVTSINGVSGAVGQSVVPGPGNRVLISQQVVAPASPVASVNFFYNFTNLYDRYEMDLYDLQASGSSAQNLFMRCSADGSTFDAANDYVWVLLYAISNAATGTANGAGSAGAVAQINILSMPFSALLTDAKLRFAVPWVTDRYKYFHCNFVTEDASANMYVETNGGVWGNMAPLKGLQFYPQTGNIVRGVFALYGIVKSGAGGS